MDSLLEIRANSFWISNSGLAIVQLRDAVSVPEVVAPFSSRTQERGVMAVHVIGSSLMTSDLTPHRARSVGSESWVVSYLPGRTLTGVQAVAALQVAEVVPPLLDAVGGLADEVGLTPLEAVGMAIHQQPWDDHAAPPGRRSRRSTAEVPACN
ncbi:hypothetical protein [Nocardia sp. BMG51109]|uniref:hypothetical protein n=1 Tax=Nocardia sp. BMG51109 TaxID=1056816 RepID=UPI001E544EB2|nr:hypothetical protein [Nocardia sp. BMG51109]